MAVFFDIFTDLRDQLAGIAVVSMSHMENGVYKAIRAFLRVLADELEVMFWVIGMG